MSLQRDDGMLSVSFGGVVVELDDINMGCGKRDIPTIDKERLETSEDNPAALRERRSRHL